MGDLGSDFLFRAIVYLVPMFLSLTVHEYAHARVAWLLGDDTASRMGRMTLNPISHIDIVGTIGLPLIAAFTGAPLIGWAKPVPVTPVRFTRKMSMRAGMAVVAIAGPASNLVLALICLVAYKLVFPGQPLHASMGDASVAGAIQYIMTIMIHLNLLLMIFNLIPLPPLDGSRLLPRRFDSFQDRIRPFSYIILILIIVFLGWLVFWPIRVLLSIMQLILGIPLG